MKTDEEVERIEEILKYLSNAVRCTDEFSCFSARYNNERESVHIECEGGTLEVNVWGDSPIAVMKDVFNSFYKEFL